jgi:hypothetical protein
MLKTSCFATRSVEELTGRIRKEESFHPTLALIFSPVKLGIPDLVKAIAPLGIPVFGSSSAGGILATDTGSPVHDHSAVCCLLDLPASFFSVGLFERNNEPPREYGHRIGTWGREHFAHPTFIISIANLDNNGEAIIRGIEEIFPGGTKVYGGFAGDTAIPKTPSVFSHEGYVSDGTVVLAFDSSKVTVQGITTSGWTGVGVELEVTSSEGRSVHTINGRPALDLVEEYLNVSDAELLPVSVNFPLLLMRPDGTEILRSIFAADFTKRSIRFAGDVPQGSKVRFSSSFGPGTIDTAIRDLEDYFPGHPEADLLLVFSCLARLRVAGPLVSKEITAAHDLWNCPLAGFFCCGEIGPNRSGTCELYNDCLSLVQIRVM